MKLASQSGGTFNYTSEFEGVNGTSLPVQNIAELVWCNDTLAAYTINQASDYPATGDTSLSAIRIDTGATTPALLWTPVNAVTDVGQHTIVASDSNGSGDVDLYYNNNVGYITDKVILGDTALGAPALTTFGGGVVLGWTGTDGPHHVNVMSSADNHTFANKVTLGETSPFGPALAFGNGRLFLAWTGTDGKHHLNVMSSTDGIHWGNKVTLGETSFAGPALSFIDGRLYLLWSGTDGNCSLNILDSADGVTFTDKVTLGDTSYFHPALAKNGPWLLSWTGAIPRPI
jgi:hypothetical protein